ncbi:bifunctional phosphoglucose/phosphomannose isomerase [Chloroflexota bacterium]
MIDLDNANIYKQFDPSGMLEHLHEFPTQCQRAWQNALKFNLPQDYAEVNKAIILGLGGSAIGGELVRRLALLEQKLPVWVHREYNLPPFLDESTLLITSSYSGNTEETLSSFTESLKVPAKKLVITTGGTLQKLAEKENIPILTIDYKAPPRAAFPHSFIPLLGILQKLGLLEDKSADFDEAIEVLKKISTELDESIPLTSNPAKQLATKLLGHVAVIYGAGILSEVAQRWKGQLNENSKSWAFYEVFSELNHNAVVGYEFPAKMKERILVVLLHSNLLHPRISLRYRLTAEILAKAGVRHEQVEAKGDSPLAQMMSLVLFGDWVSYYLAILNSVDPTPVSTIDYLKNRLAES